VPDLVAPLVLKLFGESQCKTRDLLPAHRLGYADWVLLHVLLPVPQEYWGPPDSLADAVWTQHDALETEETCTTYNVLKIARALFR
jgi:hypothetical protein